jgi:two-component sensor histidine kinase
MAFHELAANSLKHGVLAQPSGHIDLRWRVEQVSGGRLLHIDYWEEGLSLVASGPEGFGRLVLLANVKDWTHAATAGWKSSLSTLANAEVA